MQARQLRNHSVQRACSTLPAPFPREPCSCGSLSSDVHRLHPSKKTFLSNSRAGALSIPSRLLGPSAHEGNKPVPNTASSLEDSSTWLHRASFNWSRNVQRILLVAVGAANVWAAHARFSSHSLLWFPHAATALAVFWMLAVTLPRKSR